MTTWSLSAGLARNFTSIQRGNFEDADAGLEACSRIADQLGQPVLRWRVLLARTKRAVAAGHFGDSERYAHEAQRIGESTGQPDSPLLHDAALGIIRLFQGWADEAVPLVEPYRWVKG